MVKAGGGAERLGGLSSLTFLGFLALPGANLSGRSPRRERQPWEGG